MDQLDPKEATLWSSQEMTYTVINNQPSRRDKMAVNERGHDVLTCDKINILPAQTLIGQY